MGLGTLFRPCLRVAYVVEVDAVNVVAARHFGTDVRQIVARFRILGIHVTLLADGSGQLRMLALELLEAWLVCLANGNGDNPRMTLHAPLVALVDNELQGVVAGIIAVSTRQAKVEGFDGRRIDSRCTHTGLNEHRIDACPFQLVEHLRHFMLLGSGMMCPWPIDAPDGCQPDSSHFMFLCMHLEAQKGQYKDDFYSQFVFCS